jgi:hypothetical protein
VGFEAVKKTIGEGRSVGAKRKSWREVTDTLFGGKKECHSVRRFPGFACFSSQQG